MAWSDTCKIDFKAQVEHKVKQGMSKRKAIRILAKEDGEISARTMERWVYRKRAVENENVLPQTSGKPSTKTQIENEMEKIINILLHKAYNMESDICQDFDTINTLSRQNKKLKNEMEQIKSKLKTSEDALKFSKANIKQMVVTFDNETNTLNNELNAAIEEIETLETKLDARKTIESSNTDTDTDTENWKTILKDGKAKNILYKIIHKKDGLRFEWKGSNRTGISFIND